MPFARSFPPRSTPGIIAAESQQENPRTVCVTCNQCVEWAAITLPCIDLQYATHSSSWQSLPLRTPQESTQWHYSHSLRRHRTKSLPLRH
eukprot:COSAG05_NODE_312_length_11626_cov_9.515485_2_plen_90_part_00